MFHVDHQSGVYPQFNAHTILGLRQLIDELLVALALVLGLANPLFEGRQDVISGPHEDLVVVGVHDNQVSGIHLLNDVTRAANDGNIQSASNDRHMRGR